MKHFWFDGFKSYRSRLDDYSLVYEFLEECTDKLGLKAIMPPFIIPYYNGIVAEDCGISGFVLLDQGHITLHTFSYRECYFFDIVCSDTFSSEKIEKMLTDLFPTDIFYKDEVCRTELPLGKPQSYDTMIDFGPHLMLEFNDVNIKSMDDLFLIFDKLPSEIKMTPIIRPYCLRTDKSYGTNYSILTMIAESHISAHYCSSTKKLFFDIFSCSFFDIEEIVPLIEKMFNAKARNLFHFARGRDFLKLRVERQSEIDRKTKWKDNI